MSEPTPTIHVIIPAYNEEANIERAVRATIAALEPTGRPFRLYIVNDGSRDATGEIVERLRESEGRILLLNHPVNLGVGQVFRTGFSKVLAVAAAGDWVLTKEADNTSDVAIIPALVAKLDAGDDVALASCYAPGGAVTGTTPTRVFLSAVANGLVRRLFGMGHLHTFSSFYRLYRASVLRRVMEKHDGRLIDSAGFSCMVELLVRIHRLGDARISEVPMALRGERRQGASKMRVLNTIGGYLALFVREWWRR